MRLIDANTLRKRWNVSEKCEDCKQDARYCDGNLYGSELYSLRDICESIDDVPTIDAIPVEWLKAQIKPYTGDVNDIGRSATNGTIKCIIRKWQKEQETR